MCFYFFASESNLTPEQGFSLYGTAHLLWICGIVLLIGSICLLPRLLRIHTKQLLGITAFSALLLTVTQDVILSLTGEMNSHTLPLHLCDLACFLNLCQFLSHSEALGEISICLLMPGAFSAILFPNWTQYPLFHFMTLHGFLYHAVIVLYPMLLLTGGLISPRLSHIWKCFLFLLCLVPTIALIDHYTDANYLFLRYPPKGSPLELLEHYLGNPGYLIGYGIGISLLIFAGYGGYEFISRIRHQNVHNKKKGLSE